MNACDVILDPKQVVRYQERPCFLTLDGEITYGELLRMVNQAANAFIALGIEPDDRVLFIMRDTPEMVAAYLGAVKAGAVAVAVNDKLSSSDISFLAADSAACVILADIAFAALLRDVAPGPRTLWCGGVEREDDWQLLLQSQSDNATARDRAPDDMAFWVYTSGTTGRSKGVVHTHGNVEACRFLLRDHLGCDTDDVVFATSKLFFAYPMANAVMGPLALGMRVALYPDWPDPAAILEMVRRFRPTVMFSVPTVYRRLLQEPELSLAAMKTVRFCVSGGERMPEPLAQRWATLTGRGIIEAYGTSETHCIVLASRPDHRIPGCAGGPTRGAEAFLGDADGKPVRQGETGMLWVKHPCLAIGYWRLPEATAVAFRNGWFRSGDMFRIDEEGLWWHQGRADDMLKIAGQWVSPSEVEDIILATDLCAEAACVPIEDAEGFLRLALFAVPKGDLSDLEARLAEAYSTVLPRHKWPKWIRLVDEIPKTATGKVQRYRLRETFAKALQ